MIRVICYMIDVLVLVIGWAIGLTLRLLLLPFPKARSLTCSALTWVGARLDQSAR